MNFRISGHTPTTERPFGTSQQVPSLPTALLHCCSKMLGTSPRGLNRNVLFGSGARTRTAQESEGERRLLISSSDYINLLKQSSSFCFLDANNRIDSRKYWQLSQLSRTRRFLSPPSEPSTGALELCSDRRDVGYLGTSLRNAASG